MLACLLSLAIFSLHRGAVLACCLTSGSPGIYLPQLVPGGYDLGCDDGVHSSLEVGAFFTCSPQVTILQGNVNAGSMNNTARCCAKILRIGKIVSESVWLMREGISGDSLAFTVVHTPCFFVVGAQNRNVGTNADRPALVLPLNVSVQIFVFSRATAVTKLSAPVSGWASTTVTFKRVAWLSFQAVGTYLDSNPMAGPSAGGTISFLFDVLNTGTTTLRSVKISSDLGSSPVCDPPLELLELAPGNKTECRSTYQASGHPVLSHALKWRRPCSCRSNPHDVIVLEKRNNSITMTFLR